ncbi:hypothetical protein LOAG_05213, partial [Loa loa]
QESDHLTMLSIVLHIANDTTSKIIITHGFYLRYVSEDEKWRLLMNVYSCSMLKDEYITEMKNEAIRDLQKVLPPHDFYNPHFRLLHEYAKLPNRAEIVLKCPYLRVGSVHLLVQHNVYKKRIGPKMELYLLGDELVNYEIQKAALSNIFCFMIELH